jgi:hypothetical protein
MRHLLYLQKEALTSPTSGSRSVGRVRSWTQATGFVCLFVCLFCISFQILSTSNAIKCFEYALAYVSRNDIPSSREYTAYFALIRKVINDKLIALNEERIGCCLI